MNLDATGSDLHDRATRGHPLTPEEQAALQAWYAQQDQAELAALNLDQDVERLRDHVLMALRQLAGAEFEQLAELLARVQQLERENESLEKDNAHLRELLFGSTAPAEQRRASALHSPSAQLRARSSSM